MNRKTFESSFETLFETGGCAYRDGKCAYRDGECAYREGRCTNRGGRCADWQPLNISSLLGPTRSSYREGSWEGAWNGRKADTTGMIVLLRA